MSKLRLPLEVWIDFAQKVISFRQIEGMGTSRFWKSRHSAGAIGSLFIPRVPLSISVEKKGYILSSIALSTKDGLPQYAPAEEKVHVISHLFGVAMGILHGIGRAGKRRQPF